MFDLERWNRIVLLSKTRPVKPAAWRCSTSLGKGRRTSASRQQLGVALRTFHTGAILAMSLGAAPPHSGCGRPSSAVLAFEYGLPSPQLRPPRSRAWQSALLPASSLPFFPPIAAFVVLLLFRFPGFQFVRTVSKNPGPCTEFSAGSVEKPATFRLVWTRPMPVAGSAESLIRPSIVRLLMGATTALSEISSIC
jgi:hypothetical protein